MNWLTHPLTKAARTCVQRLFGGRVGHLMTDDVGQEAAVVAWLQHQRGEECQAAHATVAARSLVIDLARTHGTHGRLKPGGTRTIRSDAEPSAESVSDTRTSDDDTPEQALATRQRIRRLARAPERWQQIATGVLQGDSLEQIGNGMQPPVSTARVSQMLRQLLVYIDGGQEPWRVERGEAADTDARPSPHAVRVAHAMQAVQARNRLKPMIDDALEQRKAAEAQALRSRERFAAEADAARQMYAAAMAGD